MLKGLSFTVPLFSVFVEGGICPPDTWAAGVAPSLHSFALVVLQSMECCHDAAVSKQFKKNTTKNIRPMEHSDHAGCTKTRRSTSAAALRTGHYLLRFSSTTQSFVALNSGGSEFFAIAKARSMARRARGMAHDLGAELKPRNQVRCNSRAELPVPGICTRLRSVYNVMLKTVELC